MAIDMASVYAERFRKNPDALRAAVLGQSPDPKLDSYTALNALRLVKEADMMDMAGKAQQPTSSPSILAENLAPPASPQGLAGMIPMGAPAGQMPQGQAPQGMPQGMSPQQRAPMPQQTMQAASGGLANMYTPEEDYAEGGIVAFQAGGPAYTGSSAGGVAYPGSSVGESDPNASIDDSDPNAGMNFPMFTSTGDPDTYGKLAAIYPGAIASLGNVKETEIKPDVLQRIGTDEIAAYRAAMGPNTAEESQLADIAARKKESGRNLEEGKGVALLKAAFAVTQGNNWVRAFAGAGAAFGDEYNRALRADKEEKRSIAAAEFNMADAKRKENLGLFKEGRAAEGRYVAAVKAADKARLDKAKAYADAIKGGMNATKPLRSAFSGAGNASTKLPPVDRQTAAMQDQVIEMKAKNPEDPQIKILEDKIKSRMAILATGKDTGPVKAAGAAATLTAKQNAIVVNKLAAWDESSEAYKARKDGTYADKKASKETDLRRQAMEGVFGGGDENDETPSAAPAAAPTAKPRTVLKFDQSGKQIK